MNISITREQFYNFIKTDKDQEDKTSNPTKHYMDYFDSYQLTGKKANWNWSGLFTPFWMYYRKIFRYGILVAFCMNFFDKIVHKISVHFNLGIVGDLIDYSLTAVLLIILMRYADYIYLYHIVEKISKGKTKGGVSKLAVVIAFVILVSVLTMQQLVTN